MKHSPLTPRGFQDLAGVAAGTLERLEVYVNLLRRWGQRINLVGRASLHDPWRRHVLDSAQLHPLLPDDGGAVVDLGSGAGLPGLILAIMGADQVHLVESNGRKCAFLARALRETGAEAGVHDCRVEDLAPFPAGVVTARACAPLPRLIGLAWPFVGGAGLCLFLGTYVGDCTDRSIRMSTLINFPETSSTSLVDLLCPLCAKHVRDHGQYAHLLPPSGTRRMTLQ